MNRAAIMRSRNFPQPSLLRCARNDAFEWVVATNQVPDIPPAPNENGGRHRCRPPVAGLRSAWGSFRFHRAFWFRRHAQPLPRGASGVAFSVAPRRFGTRPCGPAPHRRLASCPVPPIRAFRDIRLPAQLPARCPLARARRLRRSTSHLVSSRFPCGTCAKSRPKKLISLQFPAS